MTESDCPVEPANEVKCTRCGALLPGHRPRGLCPRCLIETALAEDPGDARHDEGQDTDSAVESVGPEKRLGRFYLLDELGRGGAGVVYRASQPGLRRTVALKMLTAARLSSAADLQRFQQESEAATLLEHPNILPIYEVGEYQGQPYYTMKLAEGGSLAGALSRYAVCPEGRRAGDGEPGEIQSPEEGHREVAQLMLKVTRAVAHAHSRGVIHRDLKPGNILIDGEGEPYVADFGLAKFLEQEPDLTQSLTLVGTPGYAAPELVREGSKHVTTSADVFSLGAILYELLSGTPPFRGATPLETLKQTAEREVRPPRSVNPKVDRDLEVLCLKCLEKEPARRFSTAAELADEFERYLENKPIRSRPAGTAERLWCWSRRKPALAGLWLLAFGLILTVTLGSVYVAWKVNLARETERREGYYARIGAAQEHIKGGAITQAKEALFACPEEYHHWEWGRLIAQCYQDALSIPAHTNEPFRALTLLTYAESRTHKLGFDPMGQMFFSLGDDGLLKVWSIADGSQLYQAGSSTASVTACSFSPQGDLLATGREDGSVQAVHTDDWGKDWAVQAGDRGIRQLEFQSDGRVLATLTSDGSVSLWDVRSGTKLKTVSQTPEPARSLIFSLDGNRLGIVGATQATILDVNNAEQIGELKPPIDALRAFAISPDLSTYVVFNRAGQMSLGSATEVPRMLGVVRGSQQASLLRAFFSRDGSLVCTGGEDSTARVWDTRTQQELFTIPDRVYFAEFSDSGRLLGVLGAQQVAQIWDVPGKHRLRGLRGHDSIVSCLAFSPDEETVVTGDTDGVVKVWSAGVGREVLQAESWMWGLAISPDAEWIVGCPGDYTLRVWERTSGRCTLTMAWDQLIALWSCFSPDGRFVVTAHADRTARVWSFPNLQLVRVLRDHQALLHCVDWSPDGSWIATTCLDGFTRLWKAETGEVKHRIHHDTRHLHDLAFSPDSRRLAVGTDHGAAIVSVVSGKLLHNLGEPGSADGTVAWSLDGTLLASTSWPDESIRLWDASTGALKARWKSPGFPGDPLFTDDGLRLFTRSSKRPAYGMAEGSIQVWDPATRRLLMTLEGHNEPLSALRLNSRARQLLSASFDFTIRQWEVFPWQSAEYPGRESDALADRIRDYADSYWRERRTAEQSSGENDGSLSRQARFSLDRSWWPSRPTGATAPQLDLTEYYNERLEGPFHPRFTTERLNSGLSALPKGIQSIDGVVFDIRGVIQLRRQDARGGPFERAWDHYPVRVDGIPVRQTFASLQVLHGSAVEREEHAPVGAYELHYSDGQIERLEIVYGAHVRSWRKEDDASSAATKAAMVWSEKDPAGGDGGAILRLYRCTYRNPRPEVEVRSLSFVASSASTGPFLIAATVE